MEMIFIRKLFQNNTALWWASYVFHLGIYILVAWTVLLIIAALWPVQWLVYLSSFCGGLGLSLATVGTVALLVRRLASATNRAYTTPQEYFNLLLILFVLVTGIISWGFFVDPIEVTSSLFALKDPWLAPLVIVHLIALGFMLIYIPLSKMSHYVGKFFAFHKVLWDNDPNHQGSQVNEQLRVAASKTTQTVWSAPHVYPDEPREQ